MSKKLRDFFNVRIKKPLDSRSAVNNVNDIDVTYQGLFSFQGNDKKFYNFIDGAWSEFGIEKLFNWLNGETVNFMGDSITYGGQPNTSDRLVRPFPEDVATLLKCTANNYGISGTRLSGDGGMCDRVLTMDTNAICNVILGGTNDWGGSVPLGTIYDNTKNTIYGALNILCTNLINTYPNAVNILMTPPKRNDASTNYTYRLYDVVEAIMKVGAKYNFLVINLYDSLPLIAPDNATLKSKWQQDGLHFSQDYVDLFLSKKIAYSLLNLYNETGIVKRNKYDGGILDFNTDLALKQGLYSFGTSTTNGLKSGYGVLDVIVNGGDTHDNSTNWIWQKAFYTDGTISYRYKVGNGTWSIWYRLLTNSDALGELNVVPLNNFVISTNDKATYFKTQDNQIVLNIYLTATALSGTDLILFNLPAPSRPNKNLRAIGLMNSTTAVSIFIDTSGNVKLLGTQSNINQIQFNVTFKGTFE